VENGVVESQKI